MIKIKILTLMWYYYILYLNFVNCFINIPFLLQDLNPRLLIAFRWHISLVCLTLSVIYFRKAANNSLTALMPPPPHQKTGQTLSIKRLNLDSRSQKAVISYLNLGLLKATLNFPEILLSFMQLMKNGLWISWGFPDI